MEVKQINAREETLHILEAVFDQGAYSNIALNQALEKSLLSDKDKGFVTEVVYGTVARKITLEWYLAHVIEDREKLDSWLYDLNEAVQIAKRRKEGSEKFVNAILRKLLREGLPDIDTIKRKNKRYSVQYSLPVWLVKELIEEYGEERARAIFESLYQRNKSSIRVVELGEKETLAQLLDAQESLLAPSALVKEQGHFAAHTLFKEGKIAIQDESSQLVAPALELQGDEWVLDACAAPGGKTTHMASYLTTGKVTALDLYDHKLKLIQENANRLHVADKILTKKLDATKVFETFGTDAFDKILVDAPCSGIGLIRRKPDIKYTKKSADFDSLQSVQLAILESVCQSVRKDGIIVYSTCTIMGKENFEVVHKFLENHPNFELVPLNHERKDILKNGCILITPELYGSDGFFISRFKRIS